MMCRPIHLLRTLSIFVLAFLVAGPAHAAPWVIVGSRQQAMGGAGVAITNDSTATYWNPANLAFSKGWDVQLPVTIGGNIENDALEKLSELKVAFDDLDVTARGLLKCRLNCLGVPDFSAGQQQQVANFLVALDNYGTGGENVHIGASLGLTGRYDNFGFSALSLTTGTVFPNTDLTNLPLGGALVELLEGPACCGTPVNTQLGIDVAAASGILTPAQGGHLVFLLEQAGANTFNPKTQQLLLGLAGAAGGAFANNETGALAAGLSIQEFAFSYSHKLPVPFYKWSRRRTRRVLDYVHNKVAIGVVPKYMVGVSFIKKFLYDDSTTAQGIVTGLVNLDSSKVSHAFGLDIGLSYRPTDWLQFGMMARNVNSPKFDVQPILGLNGILINEITQDAQVRMGMAVIPIENLTLAFDFDATKNRIVTLPGFESQLVSLGAEYIVPFGKSIDLALRLGAYNNISGTVDSDWTMTGGLGMRLFGFHLDLSAGGSFANETIRTGTASFSDFPTRLNVGLGLKWEKSI